MMSMRPSGKSSATSAATLEVPMSKATMRFLFSLAMSGSLARAGFGPGDIGDAQGKAVGIAQFGSAHPGNPLEQRPHRLQVHGKKGALHAALKSAHDLIARNVLDLAPHDDGFERKHGGLEQDTCAGVDGEPERERVERVCGDVGEARVIPHDRLPAPRAAPARESAGTGLRRTIPRDAPPSARASGRSSPETC